MTESRPGAAVEIGQSSGGALIGYLALTFAVTWVCFLTAVARSWHLPSGAGLQPGPRALVLLGTFIPGLAALAFTASAGGRGAVSVLLARLVDWRVGARWYVFAIGYIASFKLVVALVNRVVFGEWPRFGPLPWYLMLAATFLSTLVGGQAGEEIGWRGFALPRLASRFGLGPASILLGVIWSTWHLPLFYLRGADTFGQSFIVYLLQVCALSVAMAWLYAHTRGSLLLAMLMHAAINNTKDVVPTVARIPTNPFVVSAARVSWLTLTLLWIAAAYFLFRMRGEELRAAAGRQRDPNPNSRGDPSQ